MLKSSLSNQDRINQESWNILGDPQFHICGAFNKFPDFFGTGI